MTMKISLFPPVGFWTQTVALALVGLLMLLPDWGHELRAQSLSPASHDFGTVAIGSSKTTTFTIQNSFITDISLSSIQISAPFSAANGCPGLIAPGTSCNIQVSFAPTSSGSFSGTLSVRWSPNGLPPPPPGEPPPGGTLTAVLTGSGLLKLTAVPDSATTAVGTPVAIPVLANDIGGVKPLSISAVTSPSH
ncbi:MAG: choice-of-anchor D domain-containing protein, partial [Candidatus Contendobacter sp.]|nr:choice-of-anchor D domain-containing protein [Candidatus Contendobacter sp.]